LWNMKDKDGHYILTPSSSYDDSDSDVTLEIKTTKDKPKTNPECAEDGWEIVTPGSIIKEQTTNYLASPQRQLELVKTINDGINALFSYLISELENAGLSGLSDSIDNPANWNDNINSNYASLDGNTPYNNYGAYDGFNLTSDLGNTYLHTTPTYLGTWDAKTNKASTIGEVAPVDADGNAIPGTPNYVGLYATGVTDKNGKSLVPANSYYQVTTAGTTKLMLEGYNGWAVGDRAFWDGSAWQNWKCYKSTTKDKSGKCNNQINPIKKRGVIQIQQDYIVAAKEVLGVLDNVMPKLGELDYCIPGPNPNYKNNSTVAQTAFLDWVGSMYVGPGNGETDVFKIDKAGDRTYNNFANIFKDNPMVWKPITESWYVSWLMDNYNGSYYKTNEKEKKILANKQKYLELNLDYVDSNLFQNFYEVFDKMMNKLYFNNMTSMYNESESKTLDITKDKNPGYIPMAQSGLDLTKNITYYAEDIAKLTQEYKDGIATANVNIAKLEPIKAEVSAIITAAQGRRDANLLKILNTKDAKTVKLMDTDKNGTVTAEEYQKYYANCIAEENMNFFDANTIMETATSEAERCFDGIDNDLNRLIDAADPACKGVLRKGCSRGTYTPMTTVRSMLPSDKACSNIINKVECEGNEEYSLLGRIRAGEYQCVWTD